MRPETILAVAAPLLLAQGLYVRRVTPRLPEPLGARTGERALTPVEDGGDPLRVLIAGDSAAAGVGADHQDEALTGQLVDALSRVGVARALRWQLIAQTGVDARALHALLETNVPSPFDVAVISVGVNDVTGRRTVGAWLGDLDRLAARLHDAAPGALLVFSGLPPMHRFPALPQPLRAYLGGRARGFDRALQAWAETKPETRYVAIPDSEDTTLVASDGFHPGPGAYRLWAGELAGAIARWRSEHRIHPKTRETTRTP